MKKNLSIRETLFLIIALLNLLIAAQTGMNAYKSWVNHYNADVIRNATIAINYFYDAQNFFSLERGASIAVLYASPAPTSSMLEELNKYRRSADASYQEGIKRLENHEDENVASALRKVQAGYEKLRNARHVLDEQGSLQDAGKKRLVTEEIFSSITQLIEDADIVIETYSRPHIKRNPSLARPIRFTHVVWGITEYAGREYALLAQLIAEDRFPDRLEQEQLTLWRGRVKYGWELAQTTLSNSNWGDEVQPIMDEAETHYFMNFEQIKGAFELLPNSKGNSDYPISASMWLELASQSIESLHIMNDAVLKVSREYIDDIKNDAQRAIIFSLLLFGATLALSFYSWRLITTRVIQPVNSIADTLYKATQGEYYELPNVGNEDDEIGKLVNALKIFQKNSRELAMERDKAQAANVAKSEFLANMSHEIRTPMNVVVGLSNILSKSTPLTDKQEEYIHTLQLSAGSLLSIINDLLDFSKIETQAFELERIPFDLEDVIDEVTQIFSLKASEEGLAFRTELSGIKNKKFIGDPTRIRQMLMNICANAVKFTDKGSVTLKTWATPSETHGYANVYISISDTGIGIPSDKLDHIFEKFTQADSSITRKYGGTGLGLAIAKTFAEMMRGKITVNSTYGEGSNFTIFLPLPLKNPS